MNLLQSRAERNRRLKNGSSRASQTAELKVWTDGLEAEVDGRRMPKLAAKVHLIRDHGIREDVAAEMLKLAQKHGSNRFRIKYAGPYDQSPSRASPRDCHDALGPRRLSAVRAGGTVSRELECRARFEIPETNHANGRATLQDSRIGSQGTVDAHSGLQPHAHGPCPGGAETSS